MAAIKTLKRGEGAGGERFSKSPRAGSVLAPGKIIPPQLKKSCVRKRLHDWLDAARGPAVWISAPAGAGKTTLASDYLRARRFPALWYQVDAGDGDIASFFYYMGLTYRAAS